MVYLSQPTELGTLYTRSELMAISDVCRANGLYLFVDGARLGYGIAAAGNDVSFGDLGTLCDVFYIGGTKQGALFGEAVVLVNPALQEDFRYLIKQKGGMLAKGRLLGCSFRRCWRSRQSSTFPFRATPTVWRTACVPRSRPTASHSSWRAARTRCFPSCPTRS